MKQTWMIYLAIKLPQFESEMRWEFYVTRDHQFHTKKKEIIENRLSYTERVMLHLPILFMPTRRTHLECPSHIVVSPNFYEKTDCS